MNKPATITDPSKKKLESTYVLLLHSEEKTRNIFELTIYPLLIAAGIIAIFQFAQQTSNIPDTAISPARLVQVCGAARAC